MLRLGGSYHLPGHQRGHWGLNQGHQGDAVLSSSTLQESVSLLSTSTVYYSLSPFINSPSKVLLHKFTSEEMGSEWFCDLPNVTELGSGRNYLRSEFTACALHHHSWGAETPCNSFAQHFSRPGRLSTQGWTCHAKTNLVHLKGLKGSCISGDISPAYLTHPAVLCGLEGHPERKAKPSSVFTEPLSSKACPPCDGCGSFAPARCALSVIQPENID